MKSAKRWLVVVAVLAFACNSPNAPRVDTTGTHVRKPDPFLTIRVRNLMDTTTKEGRAHWHLYAILTGPQINQNGVSPQGNFDLDDYRRGQAVTCVSVAADSVGQRLVSVIAFADTSTGELTADRVTDSLATNWFNGNTTLPTNWRALFNIPADAWVSAQYLAGHGLVPTDPIRWALDWTDRGTVLFYERTDADARCSLFGH